MNLSLSLLLILVLSPLALAGQEATFNAHLSWAKGATTSTQAKSEFALTPEDYCNDTSCKTQLHAPQQTQLSSSELESKAQAQYLTNEGAQAINDGFSKGRPSIENDPTYEFALLAQENAYEISHGLSNPFVDCTSGTLCSLINVQKTCKAPTNAPVSCTRVPNFTNISTNSGASHARSTSVPGSYFHQYPTHITTPAKAKFIYSLRLPNVMVYNAKGWTNEFRVNGVVVYRYRGTGNRCPINTLCLMSKNPGVIAPSTPIAINKRRITLSMRVVHSGGTFPLSSWFSWKSSALATFNWNAPHYEYEWISTCNALIPECTPQPERCIEGKATKNIDGVSVTLPCWKYETTYQCQTTNTCDALSECTNVSKTCSLMQQGVCVEETLTKSCQEKSCQANTLQCGETSFCLDGDCYDATPTQSDDFHTSVSALAAISAAAEDLGEPPTMFKGTAMKCEKKAAGINDCCKDSGWGQSLGMSCSPEEEALGKAKEGKLTIYVGQYCAKKILGVCTRKKRSYCVYDSKLARIIQEQGTRHQLGVSNGSAKDPTCNPITPEQLQQINFEHLDFSDFYGDMNDNMALPSQNEIQSRLQNNVN